MVVVFGVVLHDWAESPFFRGMTGICQSTTLMSSLWSWSIISLGSGQAPSSGNEKSASGVVIRQDAPSRWRHGGW